jgi:hypothetical protein
MVPENKQDRRYKQINFIGLQNNRHPSQHTVGSVHRTPLIWRPQAPDQGSTVDFFLSPHLKSIIKGESFADVAAIQERMTAVVRSIPKEAFADSFQKIYERCQQCVVKDGESFEGQ